MKNKTCPKCGSTEIFSGAEVFPKSGPFTSNSIPISLTSIAALDNYVCVTCGYVEHYIADADKLKEISQKWKQVETQKDD